MNAPAEDCSPPARAWQPLTFGGVAAFAQARLRRLLAAQLLVAVVFSASVVWFLQRNYWPVVHQAIEKMPETARIFRGQLQGVPRPLISESKFLALAVTPAPGREIGQGADLLIQLRQSDFRTVSVFQPDWGWEFDYGAGTTLDLSRSRLEPWWEAWQPVILTAVGMVLLLLLLAGWWVTAAFYMIAAVLLAWFADRSLPWRAAWRLSSAALLPGALLLSAAVFSYAWHAIDLLGLSCLFVAHLLMGWVYLAGSVCAAPRLLAAGATRNPFSA